MSPFRAMCSSDRSWLQLTPQPDADCCGDWPGRLRQCLWLFVQSGGFDELRDGDGSTYEKALNFQCRHHDSGSDGHFDDRGCNVALLLAMLFQARRTGVTLGTGFCRNTNCRARTKTLGPHQLGIDPTLPGFYSPAAQNPAGDAAVAGFRLLDMPPACRPRKAAAIRRADAGVFSR